MKEFWLEPKPDLEEEALRNLLEMARPDTVILPARPAWMKERFASRQPGGDILITSKLDDIRDAKKSHKPVALELVVRNREDHKSALAALDLRPEYLLVNCPNWKVIPLENLIAETRRRSKLLARTITYEESKVALETLELGVDGIALSSQDPLEAAKTGELLLGNDDDVVLSSARITLVKPIGTGSRVCVDTCEIIKPHEGLLTGSSSQGLFLVEGEVYSNPHISPRPFRVNAGTVSLYILTPGGKTRYLSELSAGESVLLVDEKGRARSVDVARAKIERRPMVLIEARTGTEMARTILQNAETVRLITPDGSRAVTELKPGDEVVVRLEQGGRHFGTKVPQEMIIER